MVKNLDCREGVSSLSRINPEYLKGGMRYGIVKPNFIACTQILLYPEARNTTRNWWCHVHEGRRDAKHL